MVEGLIVTRHEHTGACCPGPHRSLGPGGVCPGRQPVWCVGCGVDITARVARFPADVELIRGRRDGRVMTGAPVARPRGGGYDAPASTGSPSPAWDLADEVMRWVRHLEVRLRQHLGDPPPRPGVSLTGAVAYLRHRRSALLCWDTRLHTTTPASASADHDPWAPGDVGDLGMAEAEVVGRAVRGLSARLERAAGVDRLTHRLTPPCPACARRTLVRDDGRDEVWCTTCRRAWPEEHYRVLVRLIVAEEQAEHAGHTLRRLW